MDFESPGGDDTAVTAEVKIGLFDNERESNLESTVAMVEEVLRGLGHVVDQSRVDSPNAERAWRVKKGSAEIAILVVDQEDFWQLRVVSAVMTVDDKVDLPKLYKKVLELNAHEVVGAAFALKGPHVMLRSQRSTRDLDQSEVHDIVHRVQEYADDWDDKLVEEFGGTMGAPD